MLDFTDDTKVFIYSGFTDMRLGIFGLIKLIGNPVDEAIYAFCGKNRKTIKIIVCHKTYAELYIKKLFKGKMICPINNKVSESTLRALRMIIEAPDEINKINYPSITNLTFF